MKKVIGTCYIFDFAFDSLQKLNSKINRQYLSISLSFHINLTRVFQNICKTY